MTAVDDLANLAATGEGSVAPPTTDHEAIVERLARRFPTVSDARVRMAVDEVARRLESARITQYLPVLIERMGRDELARQETSR